MILLYRQEKDKDEPYNAIFDKVAEKYKDKIKLVFGGLEVDNEERHADKDEPEYRMGEMLGIKTREQPVVMALRGKDFKTLRMPGGVKEMTEKSLEKFTNDLIEDTLNAYYKSEPIVDNTGNHFKHIVGLNHDETVYDKTKHVFMMYHVPWCKFCKEMMPEIENLAEMVKDDPDIVIGHMNVEDNQVDSLEFNRYPLILFFHKDHKDRHFTYDDNAERDAKSFKAYLDDYISGDGIKREDEANEEGSEIKYFEDTNDMSEPVEVDPETGRPLIIQQQINERQAKSGVDSVSNPLKD